MVRAARERQPNRRGRAPGGAAARVGCTRVDPAATPSQSTTHHFSPCPWSAVARPTMPPTGLRRSLQNWPEYEAGLRRRGSLTLWLEDGALRHWQTMGPGGQARYTDAAIRTTLMVRTAFKLALRQTEGL